MAGGSALVNGNRLSEGDGGTLDSAVPLVIEGLEEAEAQVFDLP